MLNYWAIIACAVLAMVLGYLWYGPLFGALWMRINSISAEDLQTRAQMKKMAGPLYALQFVLLLAQLFVLSYLTGTTPGSGVKSALIVWAAFIMPTLAGATMWSDKPRRVVWQQFLIQAGYLLVCFIFFGAILGAWI